jgi:hypothetical protein
MIDELLNTIPTIEEYPARIESLNLAAHDVDLRLRELSDEKGQHEEDATVESNNESNADKRKAKKLELLRDDAEYHDILSRIREQEQVKVRLTERAARLRRELSLHIASLEHRVF